MAASTADPLIDMAFLRDRAFAKAMAYGNGLTATVLAAYSDVEARTWPLQRTQADAVLAGGTLPPDAILTKLAAARGMDIEPFALVVQAKAQVFEAIVEAGQILRVAAEGLLSTSLDTPEKLDAAFEALRAQAEAAAAKVGLAP
ncbi:hypothetical protein ABIE45_005592 [Methylobacterium sp. OAE515]|uniref:hypothetical protein n=1 Tax=Methylobacterium sp. OAE515 TaxID=2817895 RepID=UPI00178958EF